jgi:hypothetical protein
LVPVVASVNHNKAKVLSLFCDLQDDAVRKLAFRCDRFLMKIQDT